jgi:hypothetical protein
LVISVSFILSSIAIPSTQAETAPVYTVGPKGPGMQINEGAFPHEYGDIIYQSNPGSPNRLYIIGMSHRDTMTRNNGKETARTQAELYKIGEWLVENEGIQLLLPEGFFKAPGAENKSRAINASLITRTSVSAPAHLDLKEVEDLLESGNYFNAEMLLKEHYPIFFEQVEDRDTYDAVNAGIIDISSYEDDPIQYSFKKAEIDYLQEKRTAAILQKAPRMVQTQYETGGIRAKKAILTIGLAHINEILKYLGENKIKIDAPLFAPEEYTDISDDLLLAKENYGITIILPRSLIEDTHALSITGLSRLSSPQ